MQIGEMRKIFILGHYISDLETFGFLSTNQLSSKVYGVGNFFVSKISWPRLAEGYFLPLLCIEVICIGNSRHFDEKEGRRRKKRGASDTVMLAIQ